MVAIACPFGAPSLKMPGAYCASFSGAELSMKPGAEMETSGLGLPATPHGTWKLICPGETK
jgi:hypothetical protein